MPYGARQEEWVLFDDLLGLTEDLLPVVSNPKAKISEHSKMQALGKTPSRYNRQREAVGVPDWTSLKTTHEDVKRWAGEQDYGICVQTRLVRAIDIDVDDFDIASEIGDRVITVLGQFLPVRRRSNSGKCLIAFRLPGLMTKRKLTTANGIIEFLANGQQFVAIGTHPSGARYEWVGGLPEDIPEVTLEQFEALWSELERLFAVEPAHTSKASTKREVLSSAIADDPIAQALYEKDMVLSVDRDGKMHILCPWQDEHTSESAESSTTYFPPHTGGYANGNFKCLHAHCEHRHAGDLVAKLDLDLADFDDLSEFDDLAAGDAAPGAADTPSTDGFVDTLGGDDGDGPIPGEPADEKPANRFALVHPSDFAAAPPTPWLIRDVLPKAETAVLYGPSGSGKSFLGIDMGFAVATGTDWRGKRTRKGRVVYIAAEGAGGVRKRLKAYATHYGIDLSSVDLRVIPVAPNFLEKKDALDVAKAILDWGRVDLVIVDTWAQVLPGANENSGEDVGKALSHCKGIHRATGALVLLIHHSGKDETKGARGWSGLRAAADAEMEVSRSDDLRLLSVTKQKDGDDGAEFGFRLLVVPLGLDDEGEEITSCVVEHTDHARSDMRKGKGLGNNQAIVRDTIDSLFDIDGGDRVPYEAAGKAGVEAMPEPENGRDRRRNLVVRALSTLTSQGFFGAENGFVVKV